jgi:hypothetical protein
MKFGKFFLIFCFMDIIEKIYSDQSKLENNMMKDAFRNSKTLYKLESVMEDVDESKFSKINFIEKSKFYFRKIFSNDYSLNQCKSENCEFCCLSLNFCGSKEQCENTQYIQNILRIIFYLISFILISFLIYKIYITDSRPKQEDYEKIDDQSLNILIGLFIQNKENRKKMKM